MNKLNAQIKHDLKVIATHLPTVFNNTIEYHFLTGQELIDMDITKDNNEEPLNPEHKYKWPMPVQIASNHYRILKRAFLSNGEPAVIAYIRKVKAMQTA